jgi:cyclopropane fatty-acyl-phospholipid synthase-like methyltransferase
MLSRAYDWLYRIVKWFRVPIRWVFGAQTELAELVDSGRIKPGRAIDLGCGVGREAILLAERGFDVTAVDISPTAIGMAKEAATEAGVEVDFVVDDLTDLTEVTGVFDFMVDIGAFNDLNAEQRDAYVRNVLPMATANSQFFLMCFDQKLPRSEMLQRFGDSYEIELISTRGETGTRRSFAFYLMERH